MRHAFEFNDPPDDVFKSLLKEYGEKFKAIFPKPEDGTSYRLMVTDDGRTAVIRD